jgi:N-hydroxyarylamine O-acetyltransferase
MNIEKYLQRIVIENAETKRNLETLKFLQKQNLLNIPFENLDIHWQRPIFLDNERFFQKVVERGRGGFCYELNGLFYKFLEELGYKSKIVSARVSNGKGDFGAEYDHLAILTKIEEEEYLVDVGFGDFTAEPLKFELNIEQEDKNGIYRITKYNEEYFEVAKKEVGVWYSEYIFKDKIRDLTEFAEMCNFHQTSPESHFTKGKVCSLMTETGRKTLTDKKFIQTQNGEKTEFDITLDEDFDKILKREFSISK